MTKTVDSVMAPPVQELPFFDELRQPEFTCWDWTRRNAATDEADLSTGVTLCLELSDPENLLDSAWADFTRFLGLGKVKVKPQGGYPLVFKQRDIGDFESYRINISAEKCCVESGDTEGFRRAVYCLIDELLIAGGPFLKRGRKTRRPFIKTRISRCFFGPLKRPPFYRDELMDDVDYYPKEYLSRLAREGVNGLWLTIDFKTLGRSDIMTGDANVEHRLKKLRQIVSSCRRYGIKIYLYCCEPIAFDETDPILQKSPELAGSAIPGKRGFCPASATAREYLRQTLYSIFSAAPQLGGMIVLSVGEWHTLCCNFRGHACPNCGDQPPWRPLAQSLNAMQEGMRQANPEAELISWPYTQIYYWGREQAVEAASHVPDGVRLMHNFESAGGKMQLDKMRIVSDYWLSYIGPSPFFSACAERARHAGTPLFAKLQVGCSWECATTQYLPAPRNLYEKYRAMLKLGVSGVMQCWYFGGYPSLMTRAAGYLSFRPFPRGSKAFLERLARLHWNQAAAPRVAAAWKFFTKAYSHYPLCNNLGYIGPVHDSVVWHLHLKPVNRRLTPSWQITFPPPGDRIGECITSHNCHDDAFSMDEIITLTGRMIKSWEAGLRIMRELPIPSAACRRELGVAEAVAILFTGTNGIFRFYRLREKMIFAAGKSRLTMLKKLKKIVEEQVQLSRRMLPLMAADPSIGFHSEAEGYKFTPEMIKQRIAWLKTILRRDFPAAEKRIRAGLNLYPEYTGEKPVGQVTACNQTVQLKRCGYMDQTYYGAYSNLKFVLLEKVPPTTTFQAGCDDEFLTLKLYAEQSAPDDRFVIHLETAKLTWSEHIAIMRDGSFDWMTRRAAPQVKITEHENAWTAEVKIAWSAIGMNGRSKRPLRINIERNFKVAEREYTACWVPFHPLKQIFVLGHYNPDDFGWLTF